MQPTQLGPFQIVRMIGRGGMGAVYEGIHVQTLDRAAVKVLVNPIEEDRELQLRFEAEIEILKKLRHPNIVRLFGFGFEEQVQYYVMELVEGQSLQQELRRKRPFTWQEVCRIGWDISQALKHAHDRGIIHRDIKPANILLEQRGGVKLSDYGIAHIFGGSRLTGDHSVVGTLEYMSPEQSQAAPIGPKSDLFALGAVLYTLLTGVAPYRAKTLPDLLKKHKEGRLEPLGTYRGNVPGEFEEIIVELLNVEPQLRPGNAYLVGRRFMTLLRAYLGNPDLVRVKPSCDCSGKNSVHLENSAKDGSAATPSTEETYTYGGGEIGASHSEFDLSGRQDSSHSSKRESAPRNPEHSTSTERPERADERIEDRSFDPEKFLPGKHVPQNPSDDFQLFIRHDTNRRLPEPHQPYRPSRTGKIGTGNEDDFGKDEEDFGKTAGNFRRIDRDPPDASTRANTVHTVMERVPEDAADFKRRKNTNAPNGTRPERNDATENESDSVSAEVSQENASEFSLSRTPRPGFMKNRPIGPRDLVSDVSSTTTSHFVVVHEEELGDYTDRKVNKPRSTILQTTLASICLIFLGLFTLYMLQPVPPDVLYERIKTKIAAGDDPDREGNFNVTSLARAEDGIDLFLSLYPDDPRAAEMYRYIEELKLHRLHRDFERQVSRFSDTKSLTPIERATYEAFVVLRTDPEQALEKFRAVVDFFGSDPTFLASFDASNDVSEGGIASGGGRTSEDATPTASGATRNVDEREVGRPRSESRSDLCLEIARREVVKIRARLENDIREQQSLLRNRLDYAREQEKRSPERARKIREAILELYREKTWAQPYLEESRSALASESP